MPSGKRWKPEILALCSVLLTAACASVPVHKPGSAAEAANVAEEKPPTVGREGPPTLVFSAFKWVEEVHIVGSSDNVTTTALVFEARGSHMALVHRRGFEGKSFVRGEPGKKVRVGEPMELPIQTGKVEEAALTAGKAVSCTRETGGDECSTSAEGKCVNTCRGNTKVVIRDKKKLGECLKASADERVKQFTQPGQEVLRLKVDSPCVFPHGEALELGAWR